MSWFRYFVAATTAVTALVSFCFLYLQNMSGNRAVAMVQRPKPGQIHFGDQEMG